MVIFPENVIDAYALLRLNNHFPCHYKKSTGGFNCVPDVFLTTFRRLFNAISGIL